MKFYNQDFKNDVFLCLIMNDALNLPLQYSFLCFVTDDQTR